MTALANRITVPDAVDGDAELDVPAIESFFDAEVATGNVHLYAQAYDGGTYIHFYDEPTARTQARERAAAEREMAAAAAGERYRSTQLPPPSLSGR